MPGAKPSIKPLSAGRSTESSLDEVSQLEQHLQRQLEEDIARIFDESIYADLEVACGKLNILTHSCILKARTHKFYHKLEAILHVNIGRKTFDEIYSFISDVYTECDIPHQENEIICYLNDKLNLKPVTTVCKKKNKQEDLDESDAYATPNCTSPEENSLQKTLSSSPSTELTKEYYALVPIDGQILDKELLEQDELSSAFKSFIQFRTEHSLDNQTTQCIKPTTLSLNSSHISKINKHSIICDTTKGLKEIDSKSYLFENDKNKINNATSQVRKHISEISKCTQLPLKTCYNGETSGDAQDCGYSPDSLIADEPSSSSDYLSAAHSTSPGLSHAAAAVGFRDNFAKMNNTFNTVSDSGFENNGMLESLNSHKDVTITDISLTESTLHDFLTDEAGNGVSVPDAIEIKQLPKAKPGNSQLSLTSAYRSSIAEMSAKTSKDEKQRQNEEIVILESSSLSSETGSWESVFPPKMPEKDLCEKFINIERHNSIEPAFKNTVIEAANVSMTFQCTDEEQKSSFKSTCCFIDAASLVDEEEKQQGPFTINTNNVYRSASRPVPFESNQDISPVDFSESNDNEDSLEQPDPDSIQKDISPTIFEMTLTLEDSVAEEKSLIDINVLEPQNPKMYATPVTVACNSVNKITKSCASQTVLMTSTPNNSIISLKASDIKTYDSEGSDNDATFSKLNNATAAKQTTELPITPRLRVRQDYVNKISNDISYSSGTSFESHLLQDVSNSGSAMPKMKSENIPIRPGSYTHSEESKSEITPKASSCAAAWVVDMSKVSKPEVIGTNGKNKKPGDKTCDTLKASSKSSSNSEGCKSRSSVDSDSSERSTHKFYIDLSTLPDALTPEQNSASEASNEKKNIFSMFIDLGENSATVKEMPARLSSLNTKKTCKVETKHTTTKIAKANKKSSVMINGKDNFEKHDTCHSSQVFVSEVIQNPNPNPKKIVQEQRQVEIIEIQENHRPFPREIVAPTTNEESDDQFCDIFVRLSDLDRTPVQKNDTVNNTVPKTECVERMTRSIPDNNWGESSHTSSRSIDIISSFHSENALSLNRLFPHLKNDISRSMPGSLSGRTRSPLRFGVSSSPGERDELASDMSEMSSVQSSMCRSVVENSTTEDTSHTSSLLMNCQSRLGQDLLRMFMEEIAPDVIVEVSGRRIKAHKCILSSRCQYFAGILSGGWVESAGNVISLPPFSFSVVHFALCHIYSGISTIPDSISIVELATIADMLGLEGLKEAIMFTLKAKYCHHFHEPCQVCTAGVLECFPLSSVYGLDDLYRRCLRWITKHFRKVWPTKAFATLPSELLEKCYQEQLLNLTPDNLIDTVYDCRLTGASLHRSRWAEVVARLCRRLEAACVQFAARRLGSVVRAVSGARGGQPPPPPPPPAPASAALDECLAAAADSAPLDELCRALALLHALADRADRSKPDLIAESAPHAERLSALRRRCEAALVRDASRAMFAPAFKELPSELRRRLRDQMHRYLDCSLTPRSPQPPPPRRQRAPPRDMERVRACFVPYAHSPAAVPARAAAADNPPRVRTTKAQEERAKYNMSKSTAKVPERTVRGRATYEHAKPRYLEPRASKEPPARKPLGKLLSSSESSRNSSPVLARAPRPAPATATAGPSTDSLSDSLNTNKYATYTKNRRLENISSSIPSKSSKPTGTAQPVKARATKIPVYMNQSGASGMRASVPPAREPRRRNAGGVAAERSSPLAQRHRGSLMMATKSSSAKIVPKTIKEPHQVNFKTAKPEGAKQPLKQVRPRSPSIANIPIMERSGTFLKDEPTFGDITTNMDIDE